MRCSRSQVVNGSRLSASAGASATSKHDEAEVAGLQHERERVDARDRRALVRFARSSRIRTTCPADPEQAIEIDAGGRRRLDVEHVERVDERDQFAARASPPPASAATSSCGPTIAGRRARTAGRAETRRPRRRLTRRRRWRSARDSSRRSSGGSAVVSVRSSCRARRSDSRSARASGHVFALSSPYAAKI